MPDIVLLYPYSHEQNRSTMLFHPLGIAQINALLQEAGMEASVMDLTFEGLDGVVDMLAMMKPKVVGMYVMLTMIENAGLLARLIRKHFPTMLLVCGGPMPTLRPEQFSRDFDVVFRGEAARAFPLFCRDFLTSGDIGDVLQHHNLYPGLYARNPVNNEILGTPVQPLDEDGINDLPIPCRKDFPHHLYQQTWSRREGFSPAGIMTSYGCPHSCNFCSKPIFGSNFRRRDMGRIREEIRDIRSWGYDGLWIDDDCFTLDLGHVRSFCEMMIREEFSMKWICLSRTKDIPHKVVGLMKEAGCKKVFFGLESGSNTVLKLMNKHTTVEGAERTIRLFSQCGIETAGFFMVGYPGETIETIEATFAWALTLPLNEISFTIPFPLPDTKLFQQVSGLQADADWRYESENRLIYKSEFDEEYLHKRIEETNARFAAKDKTGSR